MDETNSVNRRSAVDNNDSATVTGDDYDSESLKLYNTENANHIVDYNTVQTTPSRLIRKQVSSIFTSDQELIVVR